MTNLSIRLLALNIIDSHCDARDCGIETNDNNFALEAADDNVV